MGNETFKMFPGSTYEFLASVWLQQQDLHGKSPVEVAEMYCSALDQIREKYARPTQQPTGRRVRSPGIKMDEW